MHITSSTWHYMDTGDSGNYSVMLCEHCGQFRVSGRKNAEFYDLDFELVLDEHIQAAAKYPAYISQKQVKR